MLLNSDVARLVLGYLAEENCPQTYQSFLNENEHLKGMRHVLSDLPNAAPVSIFGKSLCGIIDEYYNFKDAEMQVWSFKNRSHGRNQKFLSIWKKLEEALATLKSFQIASILDGFNRNTKTQCKNCERSMAESGIVVTPTLSESAILTRSAVRQQFTPESFSANQSHSELFSSAQQLSEPRLACTPAEANRRKKKLIVPKKLTDVERKNKECELRTEPTDLLLKNITGSEAMAVVGATIMSQMKKCTNADNPPESACATESQCIDATVAKHNQQSIAEMSLESLLHSDFAINEMEFGKELEELLGMPHSNSFVQNPEPGLPIENNDQPSKQSSLMYIGDPLVVKVPQEVDSAPAPSSSSSLAKKKLSLEHFESTNTKKSRIKGTSPKSDELIDNESSRSSFRANDFFEAFSDDKVTAEIIPPSSLGFNPNVETINDSDIPIVSNSVKIDSSSFDKISDKTENVPFTPKKKKCYNDEAESPAKNTRSKSKPLVTRSNTLAKNKTPKVVMRRKKNDKKKLKKKRETKRNNRKIEQKTSKKALENDNENPEAVESMASPTTFEISPESDCSPSPMNESPKNVLAAVNLQNSPRKLTLRYGLRSTGRECPQKLRSEKEKTPVQPPCPVSENIVETVSSENSQAEMHSEEHKFSTASCSLDHAAASSVNTKSKLSDIKNDLIDNLLADTKTRVTEVVDECENSKELAVFSATNEEHPATTRSALDSNIRSPSVPEIQCSDRPLSVLETTLTPPVSVPNSDTLTTPTPCVNTSPIQTLPLVSTLVVPDDEDIKLESIVLKLAEQVRKGKKHTNSSTPPSSENVNVMSEDLPFTNVPQIPTIAEHENISTPGKIDFVKIEPENNLPTFGTTLVSDVNTAVSSSTVLDGAVLPEKTSLFSGSIANDVEIESRCKKNLTGESLTVLLNETSLTQMIEAAAKDGNIGFGFGISSQKALPEDEQFRTISPTAGVFSIFEKTEEKEEKSFPQTPVTPNPLSEPPLVLNSDVPVLSSMTQTCPTLCADISVTSAPSTCSSVVNVEIPAVASVPLESNLATKSLKAWLNSCSTQPELMRTVVPNNKSITVCRTLDFMHPKSSKKRRKKSKPTCASSRYNRKLLPKVPASTESDQIVLIPAVIHRKPYVKDVIIDATPLRNKPMNVPVNRTNPPSVVPMPVTFIERDTVTTTSQRENYYTQVISLTSFSSPATTASIPFETLADTNIPDTNLLVAAAAAVNVGPSVSSLVTATPSESALLVIPSVESRLATKNSVTPCVLPSSVLITCPGSVSTLSNATSSTQTPVFSSNTTLTTFTGTSPRVSSKLSEPLSRPVTEIGNLSSQTNPVRAISPQVALPNPVIENRDVLSQTEPVVTDSSPLAMPQPVTHVSSQALPEVALSLDDESLGSAVATASSYPVEGFVPLHSLINSSKFQSNDAVDKDTVDELVCSSPHAQSVCATVVSSSEEHSLRVITSDEEIASLGAPRKRKQEPILSPKTPKKKARLDELGKRSMNDLMSFLKKVHSQDSDSEKQLSKPKEKSTKRRKSENEKMQNDKASSKERRENREKKAFEAPIQNQNVVRTLGTNTKSAKKSSPRKKHKKLVRKSPPKVISPLKKEKKTKRRVSLTSIPIPPFKLGGSPLHLRTPSPVLVCKDSPNTIALVAESLVELSRSRGSAQDGQFRFKQSPSNDEQTTQESAVNKSASPRFTSKRKKKPKKRLTLEDVNISEFLSTIKYD